jgi:hypothetical protein
MADLPSMQKKILDFRNARDWAQFHDPKNLAEALSIEAGELTCPVRSAMHIHIAGEKHAGGWRKWLGCFATSNGVKKLDRVVPQPHFRRTQERKKRTG